jgi:hypothetical protein
MRSRLWVLCSVIFAILLAPAAAPALQIVSHVEHYDAPSQTFHFSITFSGPPDFFTVDQYGRTKDAFQYWITWALHISDPLYPLGTPDVLVRGVEINTAGGIPIRDRSGEGGPNSGGWGPIRGIVPYQLSGPTITFDVPQAMLGDPDGKFSYYLGVFVYGATTDERTGVSDDNTVSAARESWGRIKRLYR